MNDSAERVGHTGRDRLLLLLLILFSYGRVTWRLGHQDLWWDESLSLQRAESALMPLLRGQLFLYDGLSERLTIDQHPFAYYLLQGGLIRLMGDSEYALRYLSAMAATLLTVVLWVLARWFVRRDVLPPSTPYWAAGFAAISPFFLWFGQEARPYALWGLLAPLSIYLLLRMTETERIRWNWAAGFILTELLFLTSHYYAVFLLPVQVLIIYLWVAKRNRLMALLVAGLVLMIAAAGGVALYWFSIVQQRGGANFSTATPGVLIPDLLNAFSLGLSVDISRVWWIDLVFGALILLGAGWSLRSRRSVAAYGWLPAAMVVVPVVILLLLNLLLPAYMTARQMALIGGAMLLLLGGGLGVVTQYQRWIAAALAILLATATTQSTVNYFSMEEYAKGDMSGLGAYLEDRIAPGDVLLVKSPFSWRIADYYLPTRAIDEAAQNGVEIAHFGVPLLQNVPWEDTEAFLAQIRDEARRVWLVRIGPQVNPDVDNWVERWLTENLFLVREDDFFSHSTLRAFLFLPEIPVYRTPLEPAEQPASVVFGDQIRLDGYEVGSWESPALALPITLYWHPLVKIDRNYKYVLQLVSEQAGEHPVVLSMTEREPYDGSVATSFWDANITILEHGELPPMPARPNPSTDRLTLRIYDRETLEPLPVTESDGFEVLPDGSTVILPLWANPSE